jgi:hypothetical protein
MNMSSKITQLANKLLNKYASLRDYFGFEAIPEEDKLHAWRIKGKYKDKEIVEVIFARTKESAIHSFKKQHKNFEVIEAEKAKDLLK